MKLAENLFSGPIRRFRPIALPLLLSTLAVPAFAAPASLSDGNSSISVDPSTSHILTGWLVDGKNQLSMQSFWYRVGAIGGESALGTLALVDQVQASSSSLYVKYANGQFSVETTYSLVGGADGSGTANLSQQVKITNLSGSSLDFHFFQYSDFDLTGTSAGDTVQMGQNLQGNFNEALQTKAGGSLVDTVFTRGGTHGQAALFPTILNSLNDGSPTILNGNAGPTTGDATWAVQWDQVIAAGGSLLIGIDNNIQLIPVPEPSAAALIPFGFAALFVVKRFRRRS